MSRSDLSQTSCTIARALAVIGDAWTHIILRELFLGTRRFDAFQRQTGMSPHLLSVRLKRLAAEGIVSRRTYSERPPRYEYHLTEKGKALWPVMIALKQWGDEWLASSRVPPITLTHTGCGETTDPDFVCSVCREPMNAHSSRAALSNRLIRERTARAKGPHRESRSTLATRRGAK